MGSFVGNGPMFGNSWPQMAASDLSRRNPQIPAWRLLMISVIRHPIVSTVIHLTAIISSVVMALNDFRSSEELKRADRTVDYTITTLYCVEISIKILAMGWKTKKTTNENADEIPSEEEEPEATPEEKTETNPSDLLTDSERQSIRAMFELFDTDNNMTMDEFELRVAMRGLGFGVSRQQAHRIFVSIDRDSSGSIDYSEFERMMAERMVTETPLEGYMDNDWNRLDLYVLVFRVAVMPLMLLEGGRGHFINALARLLFLIRPLRVLDTYSGAHDILHVIPGAARPLWDLLCLFLLFVIICAIFCISLFTGGSLHGRCVVSPNNTYAVDWMALKTRYGDSLQRASPIGELQVPERFCIDDASCGAGFECSCRPPKEDLADRSYLQGRAGCLRVRYGRMGEQSDGRPVTLRYGYFGFNNFAQAFLTVFQVCTLSSWGSIMDATMQAHGTASCAVFIVIVIVMRYWIMNVAVAIIPSVYLRIRRERIGLQYDSAMARAEMALLKQLQASHAQDLDDATEDEVDEDTDASQQNAKKNLRKSKAKEGLVSKLGDLSSCTPRELTDNIRKTFHTFDQDGSGEISASELSDAFRSLGMDINDDEVEEMAADADMDGDGVLGIEEFEDMVKKMILTVREKEPESSFVVIEQDPPLFLGLFPIPEKYSQTNSRPLSKLSLAVARMMAAPKTVDECGQTVPGDVILEAQRRNLMIQWGPKAREWSLIADRGGASIGMENRRDKKKHAPADDDAKSIKEMFPSNSPIPGGEGVSAVGDERRSDLRHVIMQFDMHGKWRFVDPPMVSSSAVPYSDIIVLISILTNTLMMTLLHFEGTVDMDCKVQSQCPNNLVIMKAGWFLALLLGEVGFNIVFTMEALAKIIALGSFMRYILQPINTFDFLLVLISDVLMILSLFNVNLPNVSFFRVLRLMRAFLMVTRFHRLRLLFRRSAASFQGTLMVIALTFFFMAAFAILGMQIFICEMPECPLSKSGIPGTCHDPFANCINSKLCPLFSEELTGKDTCAFALRRNFNSFKDSVTSMFVIFTAEGYTDLLVEGMRQQSTGPLGIYAAILFFTASYLFFNHVIANLFIAVILDNFSTSEAVKLDLQEQMFNRKILNLLKVRFGDKNESEQAPTQQAQSSDSHDLLALMTDQDTAHYKEPEDDVKIFGCLDPPLDDENEKKNVRGLVRDILENAWYQRMILLAIIVSCVVLVLGSPIPEYSRIDKNLADTLNLWTFVVFVVEMVLRILDRGIFWEHSQAYFRVGWNVLDFIVVLAQALDMMNLLSGLTALKVIRVLRPLRLLNRIKLLQTLLNVLHHSLVDCIILAIIFFFLIVVCAIFAQTLFAGFTYKCNDAGEGLRISHLAVTCDHLVDPFTCDPKGRRRAPDISWREDCRGTFFSDYAHTASSTFQDPGQNFYLYGGDRNDIMRPRVWYVERIHNFDDFGSTLHTFMQVWSMDNWLDIALQAVDARDYGRQPTFDQKSWVMGFFVIFVILSKFFITPLIIAVMIEHMDKEINGTGVFTDLQRNWQRFEIKLALLEPIVRPTMPQNPMRLGMWKFVMHPLFERFFVVIILLNTVLMTTDSYNGAQSWEDASYAINIIFIMCYAFEMTCKLFAFSMGFFSSTWNVFDLLVTGISVSEIFLRGGGGVQALRVLRLFRIFRTLRIIRRFPTLHVMVQAVATSAYSIIATFSLMGILIFVFAVLSAQFFSGIKHGWVINDQSNLNGVAHACLVLFQIATRSGKMTALIEDVSVEYPSCTQCVECYTLVEGGQKFDFSDCSNRRFALFFFDVYFVGVTVIMHLFVAVLIDSYFAFIKELQFVLHDRHLDSYRDQWLLMDPEGTGRVSVWKLRQFLEGLHLDGNPLGSCSLTDSLTHRALRMQILAASRAELGDPAKGATAMEAHDLQHMITFSATARVLALNVAGSKALPYEEMYKQREAENFYAQGSLVAGIVQRFSLHKFRRDVFLNRVMCHESSIGRHNLKEVLESEACLFDLSNSQGVVIVDSSNRRVSLCNLAGLVEGQLDLDSISGVFRATTRLARCDSEKSNMDGLETPRQRHMSPRSSRRQNYEDADNSDLTLCARIGIKDGEEIEVWLQDATQCQQFIDFLSHLIHRKQECDNSTKNASPSGEDKAHQIDSMQGEVRDGDGDGEENMPLWMRYLATKAILEMKRDVRTEHEFTQHRIPKDHMPGV